MTTAFPAFDGFRAEVERHSPRVAVVLGSGLGDIALSLRPLASIEFPEIPGMVAPGVSGHRGRLLLGHWSGVAVIVSLGRVHFYEGHPWNRVVAMVELLASWGVNRLLLTNAAGGIHPSLLPGEMMAIRGHLKWLDADAWRPAGDQQAAIVSPYSPTLIQRLQSLEAAKGRELFAGVYAALTGPCYETPAEIRALASLGADAVGMSTAREAEAAAQSGMEVIAVSTITNRAAGLTRQPLHHSEVIETARTASARLRDLITALLESAAETEMETRPRNHDGRLGT